MSSQLGSRSSTYPGSPRRLAFDVRRIAAGWKAAFAGMSIVFTSMPADAVAEPRYAVWAKVEGAKETKEFKEKMREEGGVLDETDRQYLADTVLPQLAIEENRPEILRVRRRLKELFLTDIKDEKAFASLSEIFAAEMTRLARDDEADDVVRVNAVILLGEMKSKDSSRPWPGSLPLLSAVTGDAKLPLGVRIAAISALGKHLDGIKNDEAARASASEAIGPPLSAILLEPVGEQVDTGRSWLLTRALTLLPAVLKPLPPEVASVLPAMVADQSLPLDARIRAATALAASSAGQAADAVKFIDSIKSLAVESLDTEATVAENRRFARDYRRLIAGQQYQPQGESFPGGPQPAVEPPLEIPEQSCRRAAWRLATLADALLSADGKTGLALALGDAAGPAKDLAESLRQSAKEIDEEPNEDSVFNALEKLEGAPAEPTAGQPAAGAKPAAQEPAKPNPNASPFD